VSEPISESVFCNTAAVVAIARKEYDLLRIVRKGLQQNYHILIHNLQKT